MGASASTCFIASPTGVAAVTMYDELRCRAHKLQHALRLVLNNEPFAASFTSLVEEMKAEKLIFVEYYAELERLKCICVQDQQIYSDDECHNVTDLILNESPKIYSLYYSCKKVHKKEVELHYEVLINQCLLPLLSTNTSTVSDDLAKRSLPHSQKCCQMLTSCQSNLLVHLMEELAWFVSSPKHFLHFQTSSVPVHKNIFHQILINTQSRFQHCVKLSRTLDEEEDEEKEVSEDPCTMNNSLSVLFANDC